MKFGAIWFLVQKPRIRILQFTYFSTFLLFLCFLPVSSKTGAGDSKDSEHSPEKTEPALENSEPPGKNSEPSVKDGKTPPKEEAPYKDLVSLDPSLDKGGMFPGISWNHRIGFYDWYS